VNKRVNALFFLAVCLAAFCSISVVPAFGLNADSWTTKTPMPTPRQGLGVAVVNGKTYAIGGVGLNNTIPTALGINEEYDPVTDKWTSKAPLPTLRLAFGITVYQNKIYVIGGWIDSNATAVNEVYDPSMDSWTTKASMPVARAYIDANTVNGKIYLIGGVYYLPIMGGFITQYNETQVYDPATDSWSFKAAIPTPTGDYSSAVIDNKIYVIAGGGGPSNRTQIYDTITNTWTTGKPLPVAERNAGAAATTGVNAPKRLYIIGGKSVGDNGNSLNQIYDPQTDNWTLGANMTTPRSSLAVAVVNDVLYALGGYGDGLLASNEAYLPSSYSVPEFTSWLILPLFTAATLSISILHFKKPKPSVVKNP
jgi:N-acetylneuraminic acid mutarotase